MKLNHYFIAMRIDEVFKLIHQNGVGQKIKCSFSSRDIDKIVYVSSVDNYKYQNGLIKIYVDKNHIKLHEKNLTQSPYGELLIKEDERSGQIILTLFCKFIKVEDRFIYVKALNVKYLDDDNKQMNQRILGN